MGHNHAERRQQKSWDLVESVAVSGLWPIHIPYMRHVADTVIGLESGAILSRHQT